MLDNRPNQPSKFKAKNWVTRLCDYGNAYILVKGTITLANTAAQGAAANNANEKVVFKNCSPYINHISRINNTQIDNAHDIDKVILRYNLTEYSENH